ncbi:MAG: hypothetical protein EA392_14100 [Cryomorphaceae bacterium]|nr:MAG: hypothetical protein EA392_14100 [Cryomorphaceae bacterium]
MHKLTFLLLVALIPLYLCAQDDLPNGGFEEWVTGGGFFNSYRDPVGWGTLNSETALFGITTARRASSPNEVYSGQYALKLQSQFFLLANEVIPGLCLTGSFNIQTRQIEGGLPFNLRPESISGWYQYSPANVDTGQVGVVLTRWNALENKRDTIGMGGHFATEAAISFTFFDGPIEYMSDDTPDTMMVVLVSSSTHSPQNGSVFILDDLALNFTATSVPLQDIIEAKTYPNPTRDFLNYDVRGSAQVLIYATSGSLAKKLPLVADKGMIDLSDLQKGSYLLHFLNERGKLNAVARIVLA